MRLPDAVNIYHAQYLNEPPGSILLVDRYAAGVSEAKSTASDRGAVRGRGRGRIDKREAILRAAVSVFAREGYAQACVREIAKEAGVAKPTIYNHMADKESLFREAMSAAAQAATERDLEVLDALRAVPGSAEELRPQLLDVALRMVRNRADERAWAVRRLLYAEVGRFPDLLDLTQGAAGEPVAGALADRFARLSLAGLLHTKDPDLAAGQFLALLSGPLESRSRLGTRAVPADELHEIAKTSVATFLAAHG